jgi:2-oxo-4-hydroxy-4-carboxy-5-ureidoimidazoline decarboxylase
MEPWQRLDRANRDAARAMLHACCGSQRWIEGMLASAPFGSHEALLVAARAVWFGLSEDDWREAFRQHPEIGGRASLARRFPTTHEHSAREQAGVSHAAADVLTALADGNRLYRERFGYIFIVCASGRSAEEILSILTQRLTNPPEAEIHVAAEEQAKITEIRLESLSRSG